MSPAGRQHIVYLAVNGDEEERKSARRWLAQNPTPVPSSSAKTELTTTPTKTKTEKQG